MNLKTTVLNRPVHKSSNLETKPSTGGVDEREIRASQAELEARAVAPCASIADTAGAKPDNVQEIVRLCRLFMDDESGKYNAQSMMLRIFGLAIDAPTAPSVADAAGASERERFEAWLLSEGYPSERLVTRGRIYVDDHVDDLWDGWQARAKESGK